MSCPDLIRTISVISRRYIVSLTIFDFCLIKFYGRLLLKIRTKTKINLYLTLEVDLIYLSLFHSKTRKNNLSIEWSKRQDQHHQKQQTKLIFQTLSSFLPSQTYSFQSNKKNRFVFQLFQYLPLCTMYISQFFFLDKVHENLDTKTMISQLMLSCCYVTISACITSF